MKWQLIRKKAAAEIKPFPVYPVKATNKTNEAEQNDQVNDSGAVPVYYRTCTG